MQKLTIPHRLPGLNEIISASKQMSGRGARKWSNYATMKRHWGSVIAVYIQEQKPGPFVPPIGLRFVYTVNDKRRDPDNIDAGARKLIIDALVSAGTIGNDNLNWVSCLIAEFVVGDTDSVTVHFEDTKTII